MPTYRLADLKLIALQIGGVSYLKEQILMYVLFGRTCFRYRHTYE